MYVCRAVTIGGESNDESKSKAEEYLREMAKKQLDSHCSVKEAIRAREFTRSSWQSATSIRGEMSLNEYTRVEADERRLDELKQCGLTVNEIQLKSMSERGEIPLNVHPHAVDSRLEEIKKKVCDRERRVERGGNHASGVCLLSRRALEAETVDYRRPRELRHLVQLKERDGSGVVDKAVEETLREERKREERWKEKGEAGSERDGEGCEPTGKVARMEDVKTEGSRECGPIQMVRCVSEEEIVNNKLTVEEIRNIPR